MSEASLLGCPELRGIFGDLPDTPVIRRAFDFARARMPHSLFNHVTRTVLA